ncbi:transcriptional regulator [Phaeobacter sp. NW0010-22]|uniref:WYL domain-containing protein n=1 Tax=Phaeobacter sp. NW0010-22 TaxID=3135907 RepID=UPI0033417B74
MGSANIKWATEQRFQYLEQRAFWHGSLNRSDLIEKFGISVPQASKDLASYQRMHPSNLSYDASKKQYSPTKDFTPFFASNDADEYLSTHSDAARKSGKTSLSTKLPLPVRTVSTSAIQPVIESIYRAASVEIQYQSMNPLKPAPSWRRITPHAFGNDGLRWHVRAFCHEDLKFKDFIASRVLDARDIGDAGELASSDTSWIGTVDVQLIPNPELSKAQKAVIASEYGMKNGSLTITVRKAMLYYFNKRLRLDVASELDKSHETPLIVSNRDEFDSALMEAMK